MTSPTATTKRTERSRVAAPSGPFEELKRHAASLGMNMGVWDALGVPIEPLTPCCELCRTFDAAGAGCAAAACEAARNVLRDEKPFRRELPTGCAVLALPVMRRRRLTQVATACFPLREMLDEERLARQCDRLHLDRTAVTSMAQQACRYGAENVNELAGVLEWLLGREQGRATAKEELANLSANLAATYEELSLLYRISGSMRVTQHPADFLHGVCEELLEVMNISAAVAMESAHPASKASDTIVVAGEIDMPADRLKAVLTEMIVPSFPPDNRAAVENRASESTGSVRNYIAVPLMAENARIGVLVGFNKNTGDFDSVDMKLLNSIGNQASVFLANNRLYADLQDLLMGVLHALTATIDAKDPYTCGHSQRVAVLSRRIAQEMKLPADKVHNIYLSGLLHDVGKIGVPEAVLRKPGRLDDDEFAQIRLHPSIGARILGGIRQLDEIIVGILTHHEHPDGRGYPNGLSGDQVPLEGRIIGLADSFDAMTSDRTYRKALSLETVVEEIRKHKGTQFDPAVADAFLALDLPAVMAEARQAAETVFPLPSLEDSKL